MLTQASTCQSGAWYCCRDAYASAIDSLWNRYGLPRAADRVAATSVMVSASGPVRV